MPQRVLLTGATGFVGGFIAKDLCDLGYEVYATVRKSSDTNHIDDLPLTKVDLNLSSVADIRSFIEANGIDYIVHNAGLTRHKDEQVLNAVNAGVIGNFKDAASSVNHQVQKIVFVSSLAAYGPADRTAHGIVDHSTEPRPVTAYGRSKLLGEAALEGCRVPYVVIRPTAVYGPREKDLLTVFKMMSTGLEVTLGGEQKLSFIYVKDLSKAIVRSLKVDLPRTHYFASDTNLYTNKQLNALIRQSIGKKTIKLNLPLWLVKVVSQLNEVVSKLTSAYPIVNSDKYHELSARSWNCYSDDLWKDLSLQPEYDLAAGVNETTQWYIDNKWI